MPLTIVGDADQLLFRFALAKPEILTEELEAYFDDLITIKFETNYRSTHTIIDNSVKSISYNYSGLGGPYDQDIFKDVVPRDGAPEGAEFSFSWFDYPEEEADYVSKEIETLTESGRYTWGDIFIGSRTRAQLGYIEGALTRRGIKYVNLTGGCFWDARHVQDVLSYVRLAFNESHDDAFRRVYNIASRWFEAPFGSQKGEYINHRYLGKAFLESVGGHYYNTEHVSWRYRAGAEDLRDFVQQIQLTLEAKGVADAIEFVIDNCYVQWLAADEGLVNIDESENGKLDDLRTVIDIARKFADPADFFTYVDDMVKAAQETKNGDHSKYVVISTVHRLKGKERPVVFGIGLAEGTCGPMNKPAGLLPHTFSLIAPPNFGVLPTGGKGRIEDERCIFFVLISRAKDLVYLSGFRYFRECEFYPSRFISEIGIDLTNEQESTQ